jgi:hypothetical protein
MCEDCGLPDPNEKLVIIEILIKIERVPIFNVLRPQLIITFGARICHVLHSQENADSTFRHSSASCVSSNHIHFISRNRAFLAAEGRKKAQGMGL